MFTDNTIKSRPYTQHKFPPVLSPGGERSIRIFLKIWLSKFFPEHIHRHALRFTRTQLLNAIIEQHRDSKRGSNDSCRLMSARERTGNQDISGDFPGSSQAIAQTLSLHNTERGQATITYKPFY